jgi:hypothetical protein
LHGLAHLRGYRRATVHRGFEPNKVGVVLASDAVAAVAAKHAALHVSPSPVAANQPSSSGAHLTQSNLEIVPSMRIAPVTEAINADHSRGYMPSVSFVAPQLSQMYS